jgi:TolB-like protein/Flp pilus assembly protein TadD
MLNSNSGHKEANPLSIFNELKRRNVFKVGIAYVVVSWLVAQVLQLVFESFGTPAWAIKTVLVLLATGLPFALFFAWAFEMTPEGLKRESEVDRSQSIAAQTGRKLNLTVTTLMVLALVYFAYDKFVLSGDREAALVEATTQAVTEQAPAEPEVAANTEKSIAVLPFVNMSSDPEQEYFSDGISEELLNGLAKIDSLKVAARTSSFSFKGQNKPIGEIAQVLGVKYILEGSVRKSGSQIRITAQLIRVSDGFHMWSETYDRELVNIFAIQDEITKAIVSELRVRLTDQAQIASTNTNNPEAYQEYLKGRYFWNLREQENLYLAVEHFERATQLDPSYSDAWLGLAESWVLLPVWEFSDAKAPEQMENARLAANKALALKPGSGRAYAVLAYRHTLRMEWLDSLSKYELAVKFEPESATAWQWYAGNLGTVGKTVMAAEAYQTALELDPRSRVIGVSAAEQLGRGGQYDAALELINQTLAFAPDFLWAWQTKGYILMAMQEFADARASFLKGSELAGAFRFEMRAIDLIEEFARTGKPGQPPDWLNDPLLVDPFYASYILVCAGQYEQALDLIERQSKSNIPNLGPYFLNSILYQEKMGNIPRYQELVSRLTTVESDKD